MSERSKVEESNLGGDAQAELTKQNVAEHSRVQCRRRSPASLRFEQHLEQYHHHLCCSEDMLQARLASAIRPLRPTPIAFSTFRSCGFHSKASPNAFLRSNLLSNTLRSGPKNGFFFASLKPNLARSIATESTVVTQTSQAQAWRRFGITAVSFPTVYGVNQF